MPGSRAVSEQQVRHMAYWRGMQLRWAGGGRFSLSDGKGTVARGLTLAQAEAFLSRIREC
jgi:hypothetical protein